MPQEKQHAVAALSPLGRLGLLEDTGLATLFLVAESARYLTGVTLDIAGGRIML
jgi:3-oxoacyl-[acyl-carrier protein] reductase